MRQRLDRIARADGDGPLQVQVVHGCYEAVDLGRGRDAELFENEGGFVVQFAGPHRREQVPLVRYILEVGIGDGGADRIRVRRRMADYINVLCSV